MESSWRSDGIIRERSQPPAGARVYRASEKKMKAVLRYPGSKWNITPQIIRLMPKHHSYLEPFFGSGAVLFNKKPSDIETVNDLDLDVVNLFQCIREDPERLSRLIIATPYSRKEYDDTYEVSEVADSYEKARRFLIRCWQGYGYRTNGQKVGWKNDVQGRERAYALKKWYCLPEQIYQAAERLRMVQIECRPALELIERFDYENVFMYLDPPYVLETRSQKQYKHEMTDTDHEEMLKMLLQSKAKIMISGYESEMYDEYLSGWKKKTFASCAEGGLPRKEVVWMNYIAESQMTIFDYPELLPEEK